MNEGKRGIRKKDGKGSKGEGNGGERKRLEELDQREKYMVTECEE